MVTPATPEGPRTVRLRKWLLDLPRGFKRAILVLSDFYVVGGRRLGGGLAALQ